MNINWLEWVGYLASVVVAVSLLMSSIVKLRWLNLTGCALFAFYGFSIHALPVGIINAIIFFINIYYLVKIYTEKEYLKILPIAEDSIYLTHFLEFYKDDIKKYFPQFDFKIKENMVSFYILRNLVPAGIFIATRQDDETLLVDMDYAKPEYRDFKIGKYLYQEQQETFRRLGYKHLCAASHTKEHKNYLLKMGFEEKTVNGKNMLIKNIGYIDHVKEFTWKN